MGTLRLTVISAVLFSDTEPRDIFAIVKFGKEQRRTKTAYDHGKCPVWNEILTFTVNDQDYSKFIFVQLFQVQSDADELLGVSRISVPTSGEIEGPLHVLVSPSKGEIGTLKATCKYELICQQSESHSSSSGTDMAKNTHDNVYPSYPSKPSYYDDVSSSFSNLAIGEGQKNEQYPPPAYQSFTYPPQKKAEERSTLTTSPYLPPLNDSSDNHPHPPYPPSPYLPPLNDSSDNHPHPPYPPSPYLPPLNDSSDNHPHPPYPPRPDAYPPYPEYKKSSSSLDTVSNSKEREEEESSNATMRGLGDTIDRGHHSHFPPGYVPLAMHGAGYPPHGYPSQHGYHSEYGHTAPAYPPPPSYPPAPHHIPPSPYGYPPAAYPYPPSHPYPPHGYTPHVSYPNHSGHGGYAPGMYVGHSSSGKHKKYYKHHKMPKHSMHHYGYGYAQPHLMYGHHYQHKKHHYKYKKHK